MNKKGFSSFIVQPFVFSIMVLMIILFLVLIYFSKQSIAEDMDRQQINVDGRTMLINFLKLPLQIDDFKGSNAELIRLYCYESRITGDAKNNKYASLLKQEVFKYFNEVYGNYKNKDIDERWEFEIIFEKDKSGGSESLTLMKEGNIYHHNSYPKNRDAKINRGKQVQSLNERMTSPIDLPSIDGAKVQVKLVVPKTPYIEVEN